MKMKKNKKSFNPWVRLMKVICLPHCSQNFPQLSSVIYIIPPPFIDWSIQTLFHFSKRWKVYLIWRGTRESKHLKFIFLLGVIRVLWIWIKLNTTVFTVVAAHIIMAKTNKYTITMFSDKQCAWGQGKAATMKSNFLLLVNLSLQPNKSPFEN